MTDKARPRTVQLGELLERIQRIEARLRNRPEDRESSASGSYEEGGKPRYCSLLQVPPRELPTTLSRDRVRLIRAIEKKWVNGTKLRYYFFNSGPFAGANDQMDIVREGFEIWTNLDIGIKFEEIQDISEAEVRIGFLRGDGAWSYVGRDVIDVPGQAERTMNFGWDLARDPRREDVAVHEIGHTLGFPHEHQNPFSGIIWNEQAVYDYFGSPPNSWDRDTTFFNILRKIPPNEVEGSQWDPDSIMHYAFEAGLIQQPERFRDGLTPAGGLSQHDIDQAHLFYPPIDPSGASDPELKVGKSEPLNLAPAQQKNFVIKPTATRRYTIQTVGQSDTLIVLFEDQDGDLRFLSGDDDSGRDLNARLSVRLFQGRRYVLRVRLYSNQATGATSVIMS